MTVVEILNIKYNFANLIETINQKLEKAKKCIDVEREYASKTPLAISLDYLKLAYNRKKHLKQLKKIFKRTKQIIDYYVKEIESNCVNATDFDDTIRTMGICVDCYQEVYKNLITIEKILEELAKSEPDGSKESVDYMEDIYFITKQHYADVLLLKTTADKILVDNEDKIALIISQNSEDFQDEN